MCLYDANKQVGSLDKSKKSVGTGLVGAPACGDVMKLQVKARDATVYMSRLACHTTMHMPEAPLFFSRSLFYRSKSMHQVSSATRCSRLSGEHISFPRASLAPLICIFSAVVQRLQAVALPQNGLR